MSAPTSAVYRKYNQSAKGRARTKRYLESPDGVIVRYMIDSRPQRKLLKRLNTQLRRKQIG